VLEEGSGLGAIRGSHTSKSTFKRISVDPGSTVDQKIFRTHYTERYLTRKNLRHLYRLKMPH
jgi:hypothetical protein